MKTILMIGNSDLVIYNFRLEIVERLLKDGYRVVIAVPYGDRIEELKSLGAEYVNIEFLGRTANPIQEWKLLRKFRKLMQDIQPDAVFSYTIKPNLYGALACKKLGIPFIANITGLGTAVEKKGLKQQFFLMLYRLAFPKVQRVFMQNTENYRLFADNHIADGRLKLIPGSGVNLERYPVLSYPKEETVHFAFISRIMHEKGIDQYLEAAKKIRENYPNTVFHVFGACKDGYQEVIEKAHANGTVVYHGFSKNIAEDLKYISCVIHPTFYPEGLSNVLLEAQACGRPIITTNRAGCREIIEDGRNGFVVKEQDAEDLCEKIEQFLKLSVPDRAAMGLVGRDKVSRCFDRQIVVEAYMMELKEL